MLRYLKLPQLFFIRKCDSLLQKPDNLTFCYLEDQNGYFHLLHKIHHSLFMFKDLLVRLETAFLKSRELKNTSLTLVLAKFVKRLTLKVVSNEIQTGIFLEQV